MVVVTTCNILDLYSTLWERNKLDLFALPGAMGAALALSTAFYTIHDLVHLPAYCIENS